ncbi:hypothetical protein BJY52DRAFT_1225930 [Lactarius psammicola]|nr:hypothetical protein BJY52DRAFT_1225930 [Lactarius psammicola]
MVHIDIDGEKNKVLSILGFAMPLNLGQLLLLTQAQEFVVTKSIELGASISHDRSSISRLVLISYVTYFMLLRPRSSQVLVRIFTGLSKSAGCAEWWPQGGHWTRNRGRQACRVALVCPDSAAQSKLEPDNLDHQLLPKSAHIP